MGGQSCLGWNGQSIQLRLWALLEHLQGMQQDITRTLPGLHGRWAHPPTHEEPATPNPSLPSLLQVCGEQKTDPRAARCPGGKAACRASRASGGRGQFVMLKGQSTHTPGPKLCHWAGQAQSLPSLSQPTRQAVDKGYAAHQ